MLVCMATCCGLEGTGSNPGLGEVFLTRPVPLRAHPASYTMGYRVFPGGKKPGRGVYHPLTSSAEVKESVGLHLYSKFGFSSPGIGWNFYTRFVLSDSIPYSTLTAYSLAVGSAAISGITFCHESWSEFS